MPRHSGARALFVCLFVCYTPEMFFFPDQAYAEVHVRVHTHTHNNAQEQRASQTSKCLNTNHANGVAADSAGKAPEGVGASLGLPPLDPSRERFRVLELVLLELSNPADGVRQIRPPGRLS